MAGPPRGDHPTPTRTGGGPPPAQKPNTPPRARGAPRGRRADHAPDTFAARTTLVESMLALDTPRVSRYLPYTYDVSCLGPSASVRAAGRPRRADAVGLLQSSRPGVGERLLRR